MVFEIGIQYRKNRYIANSYSIPLDTTRTLDCNQAHDLIKRTLEVIDDFYTISQQTALFFRKEMHV